MKFPGTIGLAAVLIAMSCLSPAQAAPLQLQLKETKFTLTCSAKCEDTRQKCLKSMEQYHSVDYAHATCDPLYTLKACGCTCAFIGCN
jgi:hypothetical protein